MTFEVVVAQPVHGAVADLLRAHGRVVMNPGPEPFSSEELVEKCRNADALMAFMTERIDDAFLQACPRLRVIAGALKGYNNIDVDACNRKGVALTVVPDLLTEPTAELVIGLMISVARNFGPGDRYVRSGAFQGWRPQFYGGSLNGATVAVIGAGAVGQAILRMLSGFSCRKLYVDRHALPVETERSLASSRAGLSEALGQADFVVLALHLMPATMRMVDATFIGQMKPGAYLINPARGSLVDEAAVADALEVGKLSGYGADTFEMEDWALPDRPSSISTRLLASDKTMLTPHIGSAVATVREAIERSAAESIIAVLNGERPEGTVEKEALAALRR